MSLAPIALFVYNRPAHARRTIEALRRNTLASESEVTVFADGPRTADDEARVARVRRDLEGTTGFKRLTWVERGANLGLARSIIAGVTDVVSRRGAVIVLEDDMVTSPFFLVYMNEALRLYEAEDQVISIAGYMYPVAGPLPASFFLRGADCWGWATWKRGWALFDADGQKLLDALVARRLTRAFDMEGSFPYTRMLRRQIAGRNDSWAVRWHASAFLADRLTLFPGVSLVRNIGHDGLGTHSSATSVFDVEMAESPIRLCKLRPEVDERAAGAVRDHLRATRRGVPALLRRAWGRLARRP